MIYPELFAVLSSTYGSNVPNFQGVFLRGYGIQNFSQINGNAIGFSNTQYTSSVLSKPQGDALRDSIWGFGGEILTHPHIGQGPIFSSSPFWTPTSTQQFLQGRTAYSVPTSVIKFDISTASAVSNENRPFNMPVRYLIKALE